MKSWICKTKYNNGRGYLRQVSIPAFPLNYCVLDIDKIEGKVYTNYFSTVVARTIRLNLVTHDVIALRDRVNLYQ